ncbi:jg15952 [Pararge aegeria aegeria]|uniref:Jg15952 protein n=1 Tax=Pararge aegeria aegeria TaxID=348720 RepID=A0A8S4S520_9NEOP|nr:jg15952 [Pararge aegeria aegeria]
MDIYKQYIYKLRELALREPYIYLLTDDIIPKLKQYIHELNSITFDDGAYHTYYGEIKTIVNSFNIYWTDKMDDAIKEADKCSHCITLAELIEMAQKTILMHKIKQSDFESEFQPLNSPLEEQAYTEILEKCVSFTKSLEEFAESLTKLDKQDKVDAFAKEHFPLSLKRKNDVFVFTYNFISNELSLVVDKIRISIGEIFDRLRNNMRSMQEQSDSCVSDLLIRLYEKKKEHLSLSRQDNRVSTELAEVQRSMDIIKDKIEDSKQLQIHRLQEEYIYWEGRICEFEQIHRTINKLQEAEERVLEQEDLFLSMKDSEIPASKGKCWENVGEKLKAKLQEIKELKLNAAKALQSFFIVRGPDRIFYSDNIGRYYVDDYGHQCYVFNYGPSVYQVNCQGEYRITNTETKRKKAEAHIYRSQIYQDRLQKASATYKAWKKKHTQRRKTDEIDDSEEITAYYKHVAKQEFIHFVNYDN